MVRPRAVGHPARLLVAVFAAVIAVGTVLLWLPAAREPGRSTSFVDAFFTATSATCVTGLAVVDTPTHWSTFGEVVILALVQVGGFGVMTLASLGVLFLSRRLGLRQRLFAQAETGALDLGDVQRVLKSIAIVTVVAELAASTLLALRLWLSYGEPPGRAAYLGVFHGVSAWNNAGFALYSDSLTQFATDWWVSAVIATTVVVGGLGFPVLLELAEHRRQWRRWSLHTRLTVCATGGLLALGTLVVLVAEWTNPSTIGEFDVVGKIVASGFQSVMPRTAGFNSLDYGAMRGPTTLVNLVLMFIGSGSASTGGGVKVTTVVVVALIAWSEIRGNRDVTIFFRRIPPATQRQALAIATMFSAAIFLCTLLLSSLTPFGLEPVLFESFSAVSTVGLSMGITDSIGTAGRLVLTAMMFLGRLGPITLGAALVMRERARPYRFPEERPIIG